MVTTMSEERYQSMTKNQKIVYWIIIFTVFTSIAYVWFFYEPPKKESERRSAQTQSSSASAVKK